MWAGSPEEWCIGARRGLSAPAPDSDLQPGAEHWLQLGATEILC